MSRPPASPSSSASSRGRPSPTSTASSSARRAATRASSATRIRRALEDLLAAECARGPVLLVLEDLHWADGPSIAFLDAALRDLAERPLMVLGLARPDVHERFPRLWSERHAQEVRLTELTRKASERLVRLALGERAVPAAVARVVTQAEGNPFFLEELVRALAEGHGDALPGTVLAMVQIRLEALSPAARRVLRAGSVFGEAFWTGGVAALLGEAGHGVDVPAVLAELAERETIARRPEGRFPGEEEHAFRHALVRDAAYGMLTDRDREVGHALAGAWLERQGEHEAMVLAEHFDRGAEPARAAGWYQRAAEQALEADDLEAALRSSRRVEELGAAGELLGASLLSRAEAHIWRGELSEAGPCAAEAKRLLPSGGDLWCRTVNYLGWATASTGDFSILRALAAELRDAAGPAPRAAARITMAALACQLIFAGWPEEARPFLEMVAPLLDAPGGDPLVLAHVHELISYRAAFSGDPGAACLSALAAATCFDEAGAARDAVRARRNAGELLLQLGQLTRAEGELRAAVTVTDRLGLHEMSAMTRAGLGLALLYQGSLDGARTMLEESIGALERQGNRPFAASTRIYLAVVLLRSGDLAGARAEASRLVQATELRLATRAQALEALAQVCLAQGCAHEALAAAQESMDALTRLGGIDEGESAIRLTLAEALRACGEMDRARAAIATARDHLLARAARISDPAWRDGFLANLRENARTLLLAERWADASNPPTAV